MAAGQVESVSRANWPWLSTPMGSHFGGKCTTHVRNYLSGDWDVHWGYGVLTHSQLGATLAKALKWANDLSTHQNPGKWRVRDNPGHKRERIFAFPILCMILGV